MCKRTPSFFAHLRTPTPPLPSLPPCRYSLLRRLAVLRRIAAEAAAAGGAPLPAAEDLLLLRGAAIGVGESLLVAALAGMGNVLLTNPIWMVATRMQALSKAAAGAGAAAGGDDKVAAVGSGEAGAKVPRVPASSKPGVLSGAHARSGAGTAARWWSPAMLLVSMHVCLHPATSSLPPTPHPTPPPHPPTHTPAAAAASPVWRRRCCPAAAVVRQVYGDYGLAGFWKGCGASLVMVVNPTLQYAMYEWLQRLRAQQQLRCGEARAAGARRGRGG